MQATTITPLFSAALKPDGSPRLTGGWVGLIVAGVVATPFAMLVPEALLPIAVAFAVGTGGLTALSLRQSRRRRLREQVTLWPDQLEVAVTDSHGKRTLSRFDPKTVRLVLRRDDDEKTLALHIRAGKEMLEIGSFLSLDDRSSFARAFGTALRRARRAG